MQDYIELLQQHNGAASAIAGLASATAAFLALLLNAFSVALAAFLYRENKRLREQGSEPEVVVFIQPLERYPTIAHIVVANIGKGPAHHIKLSHDAKDEDLARHKVHTQSFELFEDWRVLPQNERLSLYFGQWPKLLGEPCLPPFNISVSFKSSEGKKFHAKFEISISKFEGMRMIGYPPDHEMAVALKKIADEMKHWSSGFNRLKVETITTQEQQKIQRRWHEETEKDK